MDADFDMIVIGSGAGGGTLAATCAAAGKNVLLVERGEMLPTLTNVASTHPQSLHNEFNTLISKQPYVRVTRDSTSTLKATPP